MRRGFLVLFTAGAGCAGASTAPPLPAPPQPAPAAQAPPVPAASASSAPEPEPSPPEPAASSAIAEAPDAGPALPACPAGEVWVPPTGPEGFVMGKGVKGEHRVVLTHGYCMDDSEITVRAYSQCVEAGACKEPWKGDPYSTYPSKLDYPVNLVSFDKAQTFCSWQ